MKRSTKNQNVEPETNTVVPDVTTFEVKTALNEVAREEGNAFVVDTFDMVNHNFAGSDNTTMVRMIVGGVVNGDKIDRIKKILKKHGLALRVWQILETDTEDGRLKLRMFINPIKRRRTS
jgi:hypothetical protein